MAKVKESKETIPVESGKVTLNQANIVNTQASDFRSVYANNAAFTISAFDVSMYFGEITGMEDGKVNVEQKLRVTMSPQHAKLFAIVLAQNIQNYEQAIGKINLPPQNMLISNPPETKH
jgi:hypothetical protein